MNRPTESNRTCHNCGKVFHMEPSRAKAIEKAYCTRGCHNSEPVTWIGYILWACTQRHSRYRIAEYIGIPKNTLRSWIYNMRIWGAPVPMEYHCREGSGRELTVAQVRTMQKGCVKIEKAKKGSITSTVRREMPVPTKKPAPAVLPTKKVDPAQMQTIRINPKTVIEVPKSIPREEAIKNWQQRHPGQPVTCYATR